MTIYIDENMSPFLAKGFQILQAPENIKLKQPIHVESIIDRFGRGAKDEEWIPKAGQTAACIITQDYNIHRIKHQNELCKQYQLGMFYFKPPSKMESPTGICWRSWLNTGKKLQGLPL